MSQDSVDPKYQEGYVAGLRAAYKAVKRAFYENQEYVRGFPHRSDVPFVAQVRVKSSIRNLVQDPTLVTAPVPLMVLRALEERFLPGKDGSNETCLGCGKHMSRHFGGLGTQPGRCNPRCVCQEGDGECEDVLDGGLCRTLLRDNP